MAGAKSGVHLVQLKPIKVPEALINGNKFIKWDEDSSVGVPVTLKVDPNGFILYWKDQHKEMDCLDISVIRDTRTGKYAKIPKDGKLRDTVTMGAPDVPLEDKMLTVCYATDMCNISFVSFAANSREVAKLWTDCIFEYATSLLAQNASPLAFLQKCYTKLNLITNQEGKVPVKNFVKMFATRGDERKKIEKALEAARIPSGKNDQINPSKFTFDDFMNFYRHLVGRQEVEKIFHELGAKKKPYLTAEQFKHFLNTEQRDPRLNEILYPHTDTRKAQALIDQFEPNNHMAGKDSEVPKGHLSQEGFLRYLLSEDNTLMPQDKLDIAQDMDQPLSHYFINSSHNTYLTGHQLTGKSSVEIYRQALLTGCRCVELDCWDGRTQEEEPIITHGYTMCTDIVFREVIEAIAESAFKVSDYPVILSFENHCNPKQQAKMAAHCRNILGDMLLTDPLDSNPTEQAKVLPSPEQLRYKILVKNKKRHMHKSKKTKTLSDGNIADEVKPEAEKPAAVVAPPVAEADTMAAVEPPTSPQPDKPDTIEGSTATPPPAPPPVSVTGEDGGVGTPAAADDILLTESESDDTDVEEEESVLGGGALTEEEEKLRLNEKKEKGTAGQEAEAGMEMSALVNYVQPVHFHSFEHAEKRNRSYECVSFVETQASALLKEFPIEFVNYNKRQLSRVYPKGTRVDSSNYMPQIFWNAGCQLVALNFQTLDLAMQLNLGIFEYNGRSGFILKPDFMRRKDRQFDPFAESTVDGIVAGSVEIRVISGQFLSDRKLGTYVEVEMYGLPADTVRKKFKTKTVQGNGINPVYGDEKFHFKKVVLPTLATLRIVVMEESGSKMLGHRVLPVEGLRPGYRHITLRNELNQPLPLATLFVHIKVGLYVPDAFADFADALSNPIAYQSKLEKHTEQLAVLEEDFEVEDEQSAEDLVKEVKLDRNRNGSVLSKKSLGVEGTPQLSRVGSLQNKNLVKQESNASAFSQGSGGSGAKSTSLPGSPLHAVASKGSLGPSSLAAGLATSSPQSATTNGGETKANSLASGGHFPPERKIDVVSTTRLKDPDVVEDPVIDAMKEQKLYQKILQRQEKELDLLRKKHDKSRNNMQELHELQEEKLLLSQIKSKSTMEKTHRKSFKRASKHGNPDEVKNVTQHEISQLVSEQEKKHRLLKQEQSDAILALCKDQYKAELELYQKFHPMLYEALDQLCTVNQSAQMKRLDEIHDKEVADLKKKLDTHNREEMKVLAKKHKDKSELDRIKREARQKHITLAVQERQKLQDIVEKRKTEVVAKYDQFKLEVLKEKAEREVELETQYLQRCQKLEEEHKVMSQKFAASASAPKNPATNTSTSGVGGSCVSTPEHLSATSAGVEVEAAADGNSNGKPAAHVNETTEDTPL